MQRILTLALALALTAGAANAKHQCHGPSGQFVTCPATAMPVCVKGKPCGNTCIAKSAKCNIPNGLKLPSKVGPAYKNANAPPYGGNGPK